MLSKKIHKPFLIVISVSLLCYTIWHQIHRDDPIMVGQGLLQVGEVTIPVEIRSSTLERARGLSGRDSLERGTGMLFVFERPAIQNFWMKDMNFPLDFVWIEEDMVMAISADIPHPEAHGGEIYRLASPEPVDLVLEINAGDAERLGIEPGDRVELSSH